MSQLICDKCKLIFSTGAGCRRHSRLCGGKIREYTPDEHPHVPPKVGTPKMVEVESDRPTRLLMIDEKIKTLQALTNSDAHKLCRILYAEYANCKSMNNQLNKRIAVLTEALNKASN